MIARRRRRRKKRLEEREDHHHYHPHRCCCCCCRSWGISTWWDRAMRIFFFYSLFPDCSIDRRKRSMFDVYLTSKERERERASDAAKQIVWLTRFHENHRERKKTDHGEKEEEEEEDQINSALSSMSLITTYFSDYINEQSVRDKKKERGSERSSTPWIDRDLFRRWREAKRHSIQNFFSDSFSLQISCDHRQCHWQCTSWWDDSDREDFIRGEDKTNRMSKTKEKLLHLEVKGQLTWSNERPRNWIRIDKWSVC